MRVLTVVWTLVVAYAWCCNGAMLRDLLVPRDTRDRGQDLRSADNAIYDKFSITDECKTLLNYSAVLPSSIIALKNKKLIDCVKQLERANRNDFLNAGKRSQLFYFEIPPRDFRF